MSRIWYVSKYVALPSSGRGGTRAFRLVREMARLGHTCLILTSDSNHLTNTPDLQGDHMVEHVDGVDVCWIRTLKYSGAKSFRRILSWLDFELKLFKLSKGQFLVPDVVIVSSLSLLTIFNGLWLKRKYGCRLVFEVRDIWPLTIVEEGGFSPLNPFVVGLSLVEKLAYTQADLIVGTMPNLVEHVESLVKRHAPVACIPFGIDPEMLECSADLLEGRIVQHIRPDKFIVCYAGTIGITNALDALFDSARLLRDHPQIQFLIVGEGDLKRHYEAMCSDLPNVTFTGPVPKDMVQSVLRHCDLVYFSVHTSKVWRYGLSLNKVIDYMIAAKPVLASYSGYKTMVDEAGAGVSVPAGDPHALKDALLSFVSMPRSERAEMGRRGREWLLRNRAYSILAADYLKLALPESGAPGTPAGAEGENPRRSDQRGTHAH